MAGLKGPLFSLEAAGTIAKSITFSRWRGRPYARQTVTPANPKSALQVGVRSAFKFLTQDYANLSAAKKTEWDTEGVPDNITGLNACVRVNQARARQNKGLLENPDEAAGTTPGAPTSPSATAQPKSIALAWTNSVTGTIWCTFIHRSATGTFTPDISNLIAVVPDGDLTYVDTGLNTGDTWYYEIRHSNIGGVLGTGSTEVNATVG